MKALIRQRLLSISVCLGASLLSFSALAASTSLASSTSTMPTLPKSQTKKPEIKQATIYPSGQALYDQYRFALTYYYGITCTDPLTRIFQGDFHRWPEHMQSLELAYTLDQNNFLRRLVSPLVGVVQVAGNFSLRVGSRQNTIYEFDPYLAFRWANLPWNHYVNTSLAIGEGISYTTSVPSIERRYSDNTKRLLNYLMLEASFAPPSYPRLQLIARIHHRSGAYGLYHADNSGSNDIGLGLRYLF